MLTYLTRLHMPSRSKFIAPTYNAAPTADSLMRVAPSATNEEILLTTHSVPLAKGMCLALFTLSYAVFLRHLSQTCRNNGESISAIVTTTVRNS